MKKSSTFNLEQDIYDEIEAYKNAYNLSSRNIALERMLLERRMLFSMKDIKPQENAVIKDTQSKIPVNTKSILDVSLKNSFDNMPDK